MSFHELGNLGVLILLKCRDVTKVPPWIKDGIFRDLASFTMSACTVVVLKLVRLAAVRHDSLAIRVT